MNYNQQKKMSNFGVYFVIFCIISMATISAIIRIVFEGPLETSDYYQFVLFFCVMIIYFAMEIISIFYCLLVLAIRSRFKIINQIIAKTTINHNSKIFSSILNQHIMFCDLTRRINVIFSIPIGFSFFHNLTSVIFTLFEFYMTFAHPEMNNKWEFTILTIIWSSYILLFLILILISCESATSVERSIERTLIDCSKNEKRKRIFIGTLQFHHTKAEFPIKWTFMLYVRKKNHLNL